MIGERYGGPWQEFRAYLATILIGWAQRVHFAATMDYARALAKVEAEIKAEAREARYRHRLAAVAAIQAEREEGR